MSLPSSSNPNFGNLESSALPVRRLTTKQKLTAQKESQARKSKFKQTISCITFSCSDMLVELSEVLTDAIAETSKVQRQINDTSWHWLSQGKDSYENCSRSEIMQYKSAFSPEQWEGVKKTWEIVEDRARVTERKEIVPLEERIKTGGKRRKVAKALEEYSKEFVESFESIYDNTDALFEAAMSFSKMYDELEDTSKSYKKHRVLDELGKELVVQFKVILRGKDENGDDDGSQVTGGESTVGLGEVGGENEGGGGVRARASARARAKRRMKIKGR